jgi:hypothetical protein
MTPVEIVVRVEIGADLLGVQDPAVERPPVGDAVDGVAAPPVDVHGRDEREPARAAHDHAVVVVAQDRILGAVGPRVRGHVGEQFVRQTG